jgi:hypothetical protein
MNTPSQATAGCLVVGEYADEADLPTNVRFSRGEPVRPLIVGTHTDEWGRGAKCRLTVESSAVASGEVGR